MNIFTAARKKDFCFISKSSHLNQLDITGQSVLHIAAKSGDAEFLFACICLGIKQDIKDKLGNTYHAYTNAGIQTRVNLLYKAYTAKKIHINEYRDNYSGYQLNGFLSDGTPALSLIWKKNLSIQALFAALEAGTDLGKLTDNIPDPYKQVLLEWGWKPYSKQFTVTTIERPPERLLGTSVVCISDTHNEHYKLHLSYTDILICSGDICMPWNKDIDGFVTWFVKQPHPHKIFVPGNHDGIIQRNLEQYKKIFEDNGVHFLIDSGVKINGLNFWGTPWTPLRPKNKNNAFTKKRLELREHWDKIPTNTNVLITHGPPYGIGGLNSDYFKSLPYQAGDYNLRTAVSQLPDLKLHVFGHQHFGRGLYRGSNGVYFVNCAVAMEHQPYTFT